MRIATANSTYPKGGVSFSADSLVIAESFVLRRNINGKNPALRVAAKRYLQPYERPYQQKRDKQKE